MPITIRLPRLLRPLTDGQAEVEAAGATMGEVIDDLVGRYPDLGGLITGDDGALHRHLQVFLNDEDVRFLDALDTGVADGDEVSLLPAAAGGGA